MVWKAAVHTLLYIRNLTAFIGLSGIHQAKPLVLDMPIAVLLVAQMKS